MTNSARRRARELLPELIFVFVALAAAFYYYQLGKILTYSGSTTAPYFRLAVEHSAPKPWQYRELIPFLAGLLMWLAPSLSLEKIGGVIELASVFALVMVFRWFLAQFIKHQAMSAWLALTILAVLPFHIFFPRPYHPFYWYDTPSMVFFTLGLLFMYQRRWVPYYLVFIVGTLNRETTCFLTVIFVLVWYGREPLGRLATPVVAQGAIWLIIKAVLFAIYMHNPGPLQGFEWMNNSTDSHFTDNIRFFSSPRNYPQFLSVMAFLWVPVFLFWRHIPDEFVRRAVLVVFPFFAGMMMVANIYELRIFSEIIPLFLIAFILLLQEKLRQQS